MSNPLAARAVVTAPAPTSQPAPDNSAPAQAVVARVPQGFDHAIKVRIVPTDLTHIRPEIFGCQPRRGAPRRDADPVALPPTLIDKLGQINKRVVAWLAADAANASHFLSHPVDALAKAGAELTRGEQKVLGRLHASARDTRVLAPGVRLTSLTATANAKGRVPDGEPVGRRRPPKRDDDCDCEGKE